MDKRIPLAEKQLRLIEDYSLIEDSQERFSAVVDRARSASPFPEELRTEANVVPGCTSRVWLAGEVREGVCCFQGQAESVILNGIIQLFIWLYSGHSPAEVIATEPDFLLKLRILDQLTPTRRNGLRSVRARIVAIAQGSMSGQREAGPEAPRTGGA